MEKLWSPWRTQYIESFKDKKGDEPCIFCEAGSSKIEDDNALVMLNKYPYNSGHLMVIPYRHISDFLEMNNEEMIESLKLSQFSMKILNKLMKPHGFNVGLNLGKAAGAGIHQHIHLHIIPRWTGDTNFMPVIGEVKTISQDLLVTKRNIIKILPDIKTDN